MAGSTFGKCFTITTFGESHGSALGVILDGCPAGLPLSPEDIQADLDRRKPGGRAYATPRKESDTIHLLSGVFEGKTTGTPIAMMVWNQDQHSKDYTQLADCFRPGHADFTFETKYGHRDHRGGGRSSGRETIARVAAGAVAKKLLSSLGIYVNAYTLSIGPIAIDRTRFSLEEAKNNPLCMPDAQAASQARVFLDACIQEGDSAGGVAECVVTGLPVGLGEPVFQKLTALVGQGVLSIGAVKGIEFGDGFAASQKKGSECNDAFIPENGTIQKATNHSGGTLGGMSDGAPFLLRAAFKPTPSISRMQNTVKKDGTPYSLSIQGRHDPIIVPRAVVVVEAMVSLAVADLLLQNMTSTMQHLHSIYAR